MFGSSLFEVFRYKTSKSISPRHKLIYKKTKE